MKGWFVMKQYLPISFLGKVFFLGSKNQLVEIWVFRIYIMDREQAYGKEQQKKKGPMPGFGKRAFLYFFTILVTGLRDQLDAVTILSSIVAGSSFPVANI